MNETLVKYLAGLIDADGSLAFIYRKVKSGYRLQLHLTLAASTSIDRTGFISTLPTLTQLGTVTYYTPKNDNWAPNYTWHICKRSDHEKLLPRLIKHMVVKDGFFDWALAMLRNTKNKILTEEEVSMMRRIIPEVRITAPHRKEHVHPTWAWTAGFLDGDGHYSLRHNRKTNRTVTRMGAVCHINHRASLDLLYKAFGGSLRVDGDCLRWHRNLGPRDAKFSLPFLAKITQHTHLKKHKVETIIHSIKQRLSENPPKGEAIV